MIMDTSSGLFVVSANPHIRTPRTTASIMLDVIIALCPVTIAALFLFGWRTLAVVLTSIAVCVLSEFIFNLIAKKPRTIQDLSAVVTGLILALNVPVGIPLWQLALGAVLSIVVVKGLFGGIGQNFANPALVGRIVIFLSFSSAMAAPTQDFASLAGIDMVSSATPLSQLNQGDPSSFTFVQLLFGTYGGMLGETCSLALLAGLVYLLIRRVITWHIPVSIIGTVALCSLIAGRGVVADFLSGGLLLGAIFMATDYATSPVTKWGKIVYGVGIGLVTMFVRIFCVFPEGISFAILLFNILTPYIEKLTFVRPFGVPKGGKRHE